MKTPSSHLIHFASLNHAGLMACPEVTGPATELADSALINALALCKAMDLPAWIETPVPVREWKGECRVGSEKEVGK